MERISSREDFPYLAIGLTVGSILFQLTLIGMTLFGVIRPAAGALIALASLPLLMIVACAG